MGRGFINEDLTLDIMIPPCLTRGFRIAFASFDLSGFRADRTATDSPCSSSAAWRVRSMETMTDIRPAKRLMSCVGWWKEMGRFWATQSTFDALRSGYIQRPVGTIRDLEIQQMQHRTSLKVHTYDELAHIYIYIILLDGTHDKNTGNNLVAY